MAKRLSIPEGIDKIAYDYLTEAEECLEGHAYKAVVLLCAAALEVYLKKLLSYLGIHLEEPFKLLKSYGKEPLIPDEEYPKKHLKPYEMRFEDLIDWSRVAGFLTNDAWKKAHEIRRKRNDLIHPSNYSKIVKKEPLMRQFSKGIKVTPPPHSHQEALRRKKLRDDVAFKLGVPTFAKETFSDALEIVKVLYRDKTFPGRREKLPPSVIVNCYGYVLDS